MKKHTFFLFIAFSMQLGSLLAVDQNSAIIVPESKIEQKSNISPLDQDQINYRVDYTVLKIMAQVYKDLVNNWKQNSEIFKFQEMYQPNVAKRLAESFIAEYVTASQIAELNQFKQRDQTDRLMLTVIANKVGAAVLSHDSPSRFFFGQIGALTSQENVVNFFLIQSQAQTQELLIELRKTYTDDAIRKALQPNP